MAQRSQGSIESAIEAGAWLEAEPNVIELAGAAANEAIAVASAPESTMYGLEVVLSDDAHVWELNRRHRGKDKPTNVLSFSAPADFAPARTLGSVILAYETVIAEAREQGKTLGEHLQHLVVHGVLHLLGYDHEADREAEEMEAVERLVLASLGVADPYRVRD
jgi:probable rRNA maturation factor